MEIEQAARTAAAEERRLMLLLTALRLSRDPETLPKLEAALAPLDDGRHLRAARRAERRLVNSLHQRAADALEDEEERIIWDAERDAPAKGGAAKMARMRLCLAPREGTPPSVAAAMRAAGELQARLEGGERLVVPGTTTKEGWTAIARLELEGGLSLLPANLWALRPAPGRGMDSTGNSLVFAAAGALPPEVWSWRTVLTEVHARRAELHLGEAFVRDAVDNMTTAAANTDERGGR